MSTLNVDKYYKEIVWKLLSICRGYNPNSIIGMIGFYIALIKQHNQMDYYNVNSDGFLFEQAINLDSQNKITINDVCHRLPSKDTVLDVIRIITSVSDLDHARLFEAIISHCISEGGRSSGEFYQPKEVTRFVTSLLSPSEETSVYNPFAGIASYQIENKSIRFYSQELNNHTWIIGKIRLLLNDISSNFVCEDSICNWEGDNRTFDAVIATPPFGLNISRDYFVSYANRLQFQHRGIDSFYLEKSLNSITENGEVISLVALRFLFGSSDQQFKRYLVENGYIQKIILLPSNVFYGTSIPTAVVKLTRTPNNGVMMVDGSTLFKKEGRQNILQYEELLGAIDALDSKYTRLVSNDEIAQNEYTLTPSIYVNDPSSNINIPDGFELRKLKELVTSYRGSRASSGEVRLVRGKDLAEERFSFDKTFEGLPIEVINQKFSILDKDLLLLLRIGKLKPTYFHYSADLEIGCNPNILAFDFKQDVINPQYLINELGKDYVSQQVTVRSSAAVMPFISLKDILEIEVLVPMDFDTQKIVFENDKYNYSLLKASEFGLEGIVAQMKSNYMAIVEDRQHDMRKHLRSLRYSNKQLKDYYVKPEGGLDGIADLLSSQERAILTLSEMITAFANEEQFNAVEKVNIDEFFTDLETNHTSEISYDIIYDIDSMALTEYGFLGNDDTIQSSSEDLLKELYSQDISYRNLYVNIAPLDLTRLVSNIIGNAEMHSFTDHDRADYELRIDLTIDKERNMFQIDFRNNGTPFPLGLTKEFYGRRGKSAGKTKNKGTGGYVVKSICEHVGGDFDIYCDPQSNMPVTVRIYLPIFKDDE